MNPIFIIRRFVLLAYAFTMWSWTYEHISQEICLTSDEEENDHGGGISSATVAKYHNHFRDVIGTYYFMQKSLLHLNMHGKFFLGPLGPLVVALHVCLYVILIAHRLRYTVYLNTKSSTALQIYRTEAQ